MAPRGRAGAGGQYAREGAGLSDSLLALDGSSSYGQCCWLELSRTASAIILCAIASITLALVAAVIALLFKNYQQYGTGVTPMGGDPYATGRFVPCIYGSFPCLWDWNVSSVDWGYICTVDCPNDSGGQPLLTVVMARLGSGEAALVEGAMEARTTEVHQIFCDRVIHGTLYGHKVLLVLVTAGRDRSAVCVSDLLRLFGRLVKQVLYVGTGRFSPRAGGILDSANNCSRAAPALEPSPEAGPAVKLSLVGDVCISEIATSWDCQRCADDDDQASALSEATPWWSACRRLHCTRRGEDARRRLARASGGGGGGGGGGGQRAGAALPRLGEPPDDEAPFAPEPLPPPGPAELEPDWERPPDDFAPPAVTPQIERGSDAANCQYWSASARLSKLARAGAESGPPLEQVGGELMEFVSRYWRVMSDGASQPYGDVLRDTPVVLGDAECAEASSETFWRGAPYDEIARKGAADAIGNAFASKGEARPRAPPVAVAASEGAGWMSVLAVRERYLDRTIPFTNIRAASGYTHEPLRFVPQYDAWRESAGWLSPTERRQYEALAEAHAARAAAQVVLRLFESHPPPGRDPDGEWTRNLDARRALAGAEEAARGTLAEAAAPARVVERRRRR